MAKTGTIGVRIDEELKDNVQQVFEELGIPMSLAIEMFLKQVAEKRKLPFSVHQEAEMEDKQEREKELWKTFTLWYFKIWPRFTSERYAKKAADEFGFLGKGAGSLALDYIVGDTEGDPSVMTDKQWAADLDVHETLSLLSEAKELIYWALGMEKVFVPSLANEYGNKADGWCYRYLKAKHNKSPIDRVADGVIGARYFGVDECSE